jgi:hypothetical protein
MVSGKNGCALMAEKEIQGFETACPCGETLDVGAHGAPGGGGVMPDGQYVLLLNELKRGFHEFFAETKAGRRDDWIKAQFGYGWPCSEEDAEYLGEFVHHCISKRSRIVYECHKCGRLLMDAKKSDELELIPYRPDDKTFHGMLDRELKND